jgi:ABC-type uncharacterized transport system substrate-binding protein
VIGADPIKLGIVKSLNKPEANITGISLLSNGLLAKQAAILHETIAKNAPIGFLVRPSNPNASGDTRDLAAAAESLGHKLVVAEVNAEAELAPAVGDLSRRPLYKQPEAIGGCDDRPPATGDLQFSGVCHGRRTTLLRSQSKRSL